MTKEQSVARRIKSAWDKYRKATAFVPTNDPTYLPIERRAWRQLQRELSDAQR